MSLSHSRILARIIGKRSRDHSRRCADSHLFSQRNLHDNAEMANRNLGMHIFVKRVGKTEVPKRKTFRAKEKIYNKINHMWRRFCNLIQGHNNSTPVLASLRELSDFERSGIKVILHIYFVELVKWLRYNYNYCKRVE